jgi:lysosomal acid lipase/cholesteryl ester hydrolase
MNGWQPYEVTASDGAITTLFRLTENATNFSQSILLMHGTFMEGVSWVEENDEAQTDEDVPFPMRLLEEGYDVWLGNMRGTKYSRKHETLDSSDSKSDYWNFSWAEKGMLDVPAAITEIKKVAQVDKVAYAGYS